MIKGDRIPAFKSLMADGSGKDESLAESDIFFFIYGRHEARPERKIWSNLFF